uniref:ABC-type glycerol-3-phosphate transport system, substrate-binding protein n=1 Tax=Candidatus Kentrum sp. FM TaxID=2126340 RepID=A0A450SL17_9GAMM|nr:MAG: ABC-type glycerol-3-phosphate transport system, substrate-binding protein [Candidatus Kentron sp. FM]VFJ54288.1 MAG: ABC-type glycerol-3-phosphate transport system, substrate-binding protein [Candidatus Kentron sp. FM]VFK08398.1 MAG: ABC-type glycerol-3-phosphate transport system, substrate-binding protein [Candidatus Kentron sp. FM]
MGNVIKVMLVCDQNIANEYCAVFKETADYIASREQMDFDIHVTPVYWSESTRELQRISRSFIEGETEGLPDIIQIGSSQLEICRETLYKVDAQKYFSMLSKGRFVISHVQPLFREEDGYCNFCVPFLIDSSFLFLNYKELNRIIGVPKKLHSLDRKSYQHLLSDLAPRWRKKSNSQSLIGMPKINSLDGMHLLQSLVCAFGGNQQSLYFNRQVTKENVSIITQAIDYYEDKLRSEYGDERHNYSPFCLFTEQDDSQYLFYIAGSWLIREISKAKDWKNTFLAADIPSSPIKNNNFRFLGGSYLGVVGKRKSSKKAARFLKRFIFNSLYLKMYCEKIFEIPANRNAMCSWEEWLKIDFESSSSIALQEESFGDKDNLFSFIKSQNNDALGANEINNLIRSEFLPKKYILGGKRMNKKVFISYSWDSEDHKKWVKNLAARLRSDGVESILDQWHAAPGDQLPEFMEKAIQESDYVIIVCTPRYKRRADNRQGNVGYEGHIITSEGLIQGNHSKFIPLLREGNWEESSPSYLRGKLYINLVGNPYNQENYEDLLKTLSNQREKAPPIGGSE